MTTGQSLVKASRSPIAILGIPFDNVTTAETLDLIGEMIASGKPHYAATANVDFIVQALEDVELRRILFDAHLVLADGMPIVWASKFLGNPLPERVTGSGLIPTLLELAEQKGWKVFFLGGTEQSVATAAEKTRAKHPKLKLVGAYSPPFKPLLEMDHADIMRRLKEARPDILLVAFGCPKQEKWISMHYREAGVPFTVGVGATIDFLAGTFKRAPEWMQKTGTEWIFRMLQEPKRLVKRYGKDMRVFCVDIFRQWWQMKSHTSPAVVRKTAVVADEFGDQVILSPARLGANEVQSGHETWLSAVERGNVFFDLSATGFVDSTGIGMLIRLRKRARELDHEFWLIAPKPTLLKTLQLMKLQDFFLIQTSLTCARLINPGKSGKVPVTSFATDKELQISWSGEVTARNAVDIGARTDSELSQLGPGMSVVVDLSRLVFIDSTGVGMMIRLKKNLQRRDIKIVFTRPAMPVRNVLAHTRLDKYLLDESI